MSEEPTRYGPSHYWFAWRPVRTPDEGWVWLRLVWRRKKSTADGESWVYGG